MSKEYYEGMFSSLKHNIFLLLNQMEANLKYSEGATIFEYLESIESRIKDIKNKHYANCTKENKVAFVKDSDLIDVAKKIKKDEDDNCTKDDEVKG